jgi:hypothetical protein
MPSIKLNENVIESTAGAPLLTTQSNNNTKPSLNLMISKSFIRLMFLLNFHSVHRP